MKEKISIIVPVYNSEKYLESCIDSILCQTYSNLEIILINDGSTDKSGEICDNYCKKDKRIKFINQENCGVSKARNNGIKNSTGKYICFVDSDDTIKINMIEVLYKNMIENKVDLSMCNYNYINKTKIKYKKHENIMLKTRIEFYKNYNIYRGFLCNKMFKSKIIKKISLDEQIYFCEDELFIVEYMEQVKNAFYDGTPLYNYYINNCSLSNCKEYNSKKITIINAKEKVLNILHKYDFKVYANYYYEYFKILNDIKNKYNKNIISTAKLEKEYRKIMSYKEYGLKKRLRILIEYKLNNLYQIVRILYHLING